LALLYDYTHSARVTQTKRVFKQLLYPLISEHGPPDVTS